MAMFKLPRLKANLAIVNGQGKPLDYFLRFWNIEVAPRIENQEAAQDQTIADLAEIVAQLQALAAATQQAQTTANNAQQSADAGSGTAKSGSASDPNIGIPASTAWITGPVVSLTGVSAGNLTISGTGPQQSTNVTMTGGRGIAALQFRVVEIIGGVDEVLFTGSFAVQNFESGATIATVTNNSTEDVQNFSSSRSSTGDVDYRLDVRGNGSREVSNLLLYIFARRA